MKRAVIIDTDPGIDDAAALAIALGSQALDVRLITTVAGNVGLEAVTDNTLKLLSFMDKEVPVAKGAYEPLLEPFVDASDIHGESGMDGYEFESRSEAMLIEDDAVNAMYKEIMASKEKITIIAIAPLTNIAMLLKMYPEVKVNIDEIVIMGGSTTRGNRGVMSEFNIATDPEAAEIVFRSGVNMVVAGLDVGWKATVLPEDAEAMRQVNKIGDMLYHLFKRYRVKTFEKGFQMYDSCVLAYLLKPEMFKIVETYVTVELTQGHCRGCTVVDLKGIMGRESNVRMCIDLDQTQFRKWFVDEIGNFG